LDEQSEDLRNAMRQWTTGVSIVCSGWERQIHGMTVNSFSSVSLDPPLISVSLANDSRTGKMVQESGLFSVSILHEGQRDLADIFSGKTGEKENRFDGVELIQHSDGVPAIKNSLAILNCLVREKLILKNSTLYLAEVTHSEVTDEGKPLIYHNRGYWTL